MSTVNLPLGEVIASGFPQMNGPIVSTTNKPVNTVTVTTTASPAPAPASATPQPAPVPVLNPATLLGNAARMFPSPSDIPLNLDAAFAAGIPDGIPYPFAESAGPYIPSHYAADYQAYLDYTGIVTGVQNFMLSNAGATPPPQRCQDLATFAGDSFLYQGMIYTPQQWSPF